MKYKDLITNTDIAPYYIPDIVIGRFPITEASKNSDKNHLEYKALHNCAWRFAYEDDYYDAENYEYCDVDIECFCTLMRNSGGPKDEDFYFYRNAGHPNHCIYIPRFREPYIPCDILIDFDKMDPDVKQIDFLIVLLASKDVPLNFDYLTKLIVILSSLTDLDMFNIRER